MHTLLACESPQPDTNVLPKIHPPKSICASFFDIRSPLLVPSLQTRESTPGLLQSHTHTHTIAICDSWLWPENESYSKTLNYKTNAAIGADLLPRWFPQYPLGLLFPCLGSDISRLLFWPRHVVHLYDERARYILAKVQRLHQFVILKSVRD